MGGGERDSRTPSSSERDRTGWPPRCGWPPPGCGCGWSSAAERPGGGMRTEELIRPGLPPRRLLDRAADGRGRAVLPRVRPRRAAASGCVQPEINFAHPLDGGRAARLPRSLEETAAGPGRGRRGLPPAVRPAGRARHRRRRLLPDQPRCAGCRPAAPPQIAHFGLNGLPNVRWLAAPVLRHRGGTRAARRRRRARDARPHPAAHLGARDAAGHAGPPRRAGR